MISGKMHKSSYIFLVLIVFTILLSVHSQNTINKIWLGVDNNLRTNVQDQNIKKALINAKLKTVVPTSGGIIMAYTLADG